MNRRTGAAVNMSNARGAPYDIRIKRDARNRDFIEVDGTGSMDVQEEDGHRHEELVHVKLKVRDLSETNWGTQNYPQSIPWESPDHAMDVQGDLKRLDFAPDRNHFVRADFAAWLLRYVGPPTMLHTGNHMQIGAVTLLQGERLGMEKHDDALQMFYAIRGVGRVFSGDGSSAAIMDGMVVVVPPGRYHDPANFNAQPLYLVTVYVPLAHPTATGVYANKYRRPEYAPQLKAQPVPVSPISHAMISLAPFVSREEPISSEQHTLVRQDQLRISSFAIGVHRMLLLYQEGYYYVVGGRVHLERARDHTFVRETTLEPGALFYVPSHTILQCVADGETRAHLIGFMRVDGEQMPLYDQLVADFGEDRARELKKQAQQVEGALATEVEPIVPESDFQTLANTVLNAEEEMPQSSSSTYSTPLPRGPRSSLSVADLQMGAGSLRNIATPTRRTPGTTDELTQAMHAAVRRLRQDLTESDDDSDDAFLEDDFAD